MSTYNCNLQLDCVLSINFSSYVRVKGQGQISRLLFQLWNNKIHYHIKLHQNLTNGFPVLGSLKIRSVDIFLHGYEYSCTHTPDIGELYFKRYRFLNVCISKNRLGM